MTFTYDPEDISSALSQVRLGIGDTNKDDPFLTDEEINHYISVAGSTNDAKIRACRAIVAQLARSVNTSVSGISSAKESKYRQYKELLTELMGGASGALSGAGVSDAAAPHVGGISKSREETADADSDLRPNSFSVGMHDFDSSFNEPLDESS